MPLSYNEGNFGKNLNKKTKSIFPNKAVLNDSHFRMKLLSLQYGATMNAQTYVIPCKLFRIFFRLANIPSPQLKQN